MIAFKVRSMHVWMNGAVVDATEPQVRVDDHGLVVGDGGFETLKTVRGEPFAITRHLRRLSKTLDALDIDNPGDAVLRAAINECLEAHFAVADAEARIRLTVTGGSGSLGSGSPTGPPNVIVITTPLLAAPGGTAITVPWTRNERSATAGLKTTSYAENVRALRAAHDADASEAIFANTRGELCEGTGTNVFAVVDGRCVTPPLDSGCLAGVTREIVLLVADIDETALPVEVLRSADELFLTSSTRDIQPLVRVDDRELSAGPVTERIAAAFAERVATTTDP